MYFPYTCVYISRKEFLKWKGTVAGRNVEFNDSVKY